MPVPALVLPYAKLLSLLPARARVREALQRWSIGAGIDPTWLDRIAWVESSWRLGVVGDNGTSFGPTQLHLPTLHALGFTGDPMDLTRDVELAAEWSVKLMLANDPQTLEDAAAMWNAGKKYAKLPAGHVTLGYVAKVKAVRLPALESEAA